MNQLTERMYRDSARCLICSNAVMDYEPYLVVYAAPSGDDRIAHGDQRTGVLHVRHLQNVFNPAMIAVRVFDNPMAGPNSQRVEIQVQP